MAADDRNRRDWLNREWDALVRGDEVGINPEYAAILRELHGRDDAPGPTPAFVRALWDELEPVTRPSKLRLIWSAPGLALAALLALLLITAGVLGVLLNDSPPENGQQISLTDPTATQAAGTPAPDSTPTEAAGETPPRAIASPTAPNATETPSISATEAGETPPTGATEAVDTPTVNPDATVPTGPPQQAQFGGGPEYLSLADYVNNADLIVVGSVSGPPTIDAQGLVYHPVVVDQNVRGDVVEELVVYGMSERDVTVEQYVFLLNGPIEAATGTYYHIHFFVPLDDGIVMPLDFESSEYHPRADHGGQPAQNLIDEIQALPPVEDEIHALLEQHGWTPIRKGYLWPQTLPAREAFDQSGPMPRRRPSWAALLAASERVGLDFSGLAGQSAQLLPVVVERDRMDGEHLIYAEFVIVDQQVVGAWVMVLPDQSGGLFGLDERDAALDVPVLIPTPEPTPTLAVPSGATVNPAEFYRLTETETFILCWPYCVEEPVTVAFRDSIVAALDRELAIEPVEAHPTPTQPGELKQATGEAVWIVFGYLDPLLPAFGFYCDRVNGLVLLPYGAGWVDAPPELAAAMDGVEPPPPPTKER